MNCCNIDIADYEVVLLSILRTGIPRWIKAGFGFFEQNLKSEV